MSQDKTPDLHPSIVALTTLAASVAAGHPTQPRCQLNRLREMGLPEAQIETVVEVARHVREETARRNDEDLDAALGASKEASQKESGGGCCGSETQAEPEPAQTGSSCC